MRWLGVTAVVVIGCGDNFEVPDARVRDAVVAPDGAIPDVPPDGNGGLDAMADAGWLDALVDAPIADAPIADAPMADAPMADAPMADAPIADAPIADAPIADAGADQVAPTIVSVTPPASAPGVWLHDPFVVTFSEPVAAMSITTQSMRLVDAANQDLTGSVVLTGGGQVAVARAFDGAMAVGTLRLELATTITDLAGNPLGAPATFTWTLAPWAKRAGGYAVGSSPQSPAVTVIGETVVVATSIDTTGGRRISVVDGDAQALGGVLGAGNAVAPAIAGTATGEAVVAWTNTMTGTIETALWTGATWTNLPSPGAGSRAAVAASPSGGFGIAYVTSAGALGAARLMGTTWVAMSGSPVAATSIVADPALAMPDDTTLAAVFVDRVAGVDNVRTIRFTTSPLALPSLTLTALPPAGAATTVAIAARGSTLAIAWDESSGHSLSAHVAIAGASSWTVLPTLDVDPPGNAHTLGLGLDATNAPVASWIEPIEGAQRGFVARWSGAAWATLGGDAWNTSAAVTPTDARLVLWRDRIPVVAWLDSGATTLEIARFNGPGTARYGLASRASLAGCAMSATAPPSTLSATGCFSIAGGAAAPHPGLVPYDLRSELWSDGALKRRWVAPPDGQTMTVAANGSLDGPVGSFVIKQFAIGNPVTPTIVETRFLVRVATGWEGLSYRWRFDGTDADLLAGNGATTVDWPLPGGGTHTQEYPSRNQCKRCHDPSVGPLLGVRRGQLARRYDYGGVLDDQLRALDHVGVLAAATAPAPHPAPHDPRISLESRVRGYLAANCSHCHNPAGERPMQDFRLQTPLANTGICDLVTLGNPAGSRLYQRVSSRPGMPPIATNLLDPLIIDVLAAWITQLTSCP